MRPSPLRSLLRPSRPFPARLAALALAVAALLPNPAWAQREPVRELRGPFPVLEVIDGDTVRIRSDLARRTVRLIGIDTPEIAHPERGREPFGEEAGDFLRDLLPVGTPVWVELDREREDAYGRLLGYLYLPHPEGDWHADGREYLQVNEEIARAGYARPLAIPPNVQYADLFERAVAGARAEGRGMWGDGTGRRGTDDRQDAAGGGSGAAPGAAPPTEAPAPAPAPTGDVRIVCALYNPEGDDTGTEWVALEVLAPTDTRGTFLFDEGSGSTFPLPPGVQEPGELRVQNPGPGVWNNGGDVIFLMRGDEVVDSWDYSGFDEDQGDVVCRP